MIQTSEYYFGVVCNSTVSDTYVSDFGLYQNERGEKINAAGL